jgi:hypothetical protein
MKIIKRSGAEVTFDPQKIIVAITKANESVVPSERMSEIQIKRIAEDVESAANNMNRSLSVEEIQDMVEDQIMNQRAFDVARRYITYRYNRALVRKANTTDEQILSLIECNNEEVKQENSNKNPTVNSVQRDYMAGEVSKDITKRILLSPEILNTFFIVLFIEQITIVPPFLLISPYLPIINPIPVLSIKDRFSKLNTKLTIEYFLIILQTFFLSSSTLD